MDDDQRRPVVEERMLSTEGADVEEHTARVRRPEIDQLRWERVPLRSEPELDRAALADELHRLLLLRETNVGCEVALTGKEATRPAFR